jgi:4-hydroxybenzoate polyprenyltransferase
MTLQAFRVFRPLNILILILCQFLVFYFLNPSPVIRNLSDPQFLAFVALVFASSLIAAAGYLVNDLFDEQIDHKNKPDRTPIMHWSRAQANIVYAAFNLIALVIGLWLSWGMFQVLLTTILILYLYSARLQKLPLVGNLSIATLSALSLLVIKFVAFETPAKLLLFYAGFAFLVSLIREIAKDVQDMEGDQLHGHRTAPIAWGYKTAKRLSFGLALGSLILFLVGLQFGLKGIVLDTSPLSLQMLYNNLFVALPFLFLLGVIYKSKTSEDFGFVSSVCKYIMYTGMLGMAFF